MINPANLCIFEGRIAKDPQYSTVQMGQDSVEKAMFSIAVDRTLSSAQRQKVKNGDQSIKTADFIPCSLLGAQVATLRQYFPKGKAIRIMGHYTEYQTQDQQTGQKKYGHIFEIDNISFTVADSKNIQQAASQQVPQQQYQQAPPQQGYQPNMYQAPQPQYQQAPPQPQFSQPVQPDFTMFDENESPF